ncbi:TlpA disulfide reductase family protein [Xinfangfangia sp. CPCC 101601]|nr:TlpA disulfide reductase family protein [Xinfangfangia sp. CPCC 101601]MDQ2067167.1 TlpA disulfide reductase family protein [Xinfangfangia sp. CPCC 101601]
MGGLALGPMALSGERAAVLAGLIVLLLATGLIARRMGPAIAGWASAAAISGGIAARLGFVVQNATTYLADPLSVFAIWQGGFSPLWGIAGFALATGWHLWRNPDLILPAAASVLFAVGGWNIVWQLTRGEAVALPSGAVLATLSGAPVAPGDWEGRPLVINLWASWCPPCRREMPMMAELAAADTGAEFVFVNQGEGAEAVRRYLSREGIVIAPVLDPTSQLMRHYGSMGLPVTLFIDAQGQLHTAHMGEISRAGLLAGIAAIRTGTE